MLLTRDISPKTHRGVIAAVSEQFVQSGLVSHEIWEYLAAGETIREEADYSSERRIDMVRSHSTLKHAKVFVEACSLIMRSIDMSPDTGG